jgi:hypothetical protein
MLPSRGYLHRTFRCEDEVKTFTLKWLLKAVKANMVRGKGLILERLARTAHRAPQEARDPNSLCRVHKFNAQPLAEDRRGSVKRVERYACVCGIEKPIHLRAACLHSVS